MGAQHILSTWILFRQLPHSSWASVWTRKTGYITDQVNQSTWITTEALSCFSGMRLSFCFFYICSIPELCIVLRNGQERLNTVRIHGPNECILCPFQLTQDHWWKIKRESQNLCWKRERAPKGFFPSINCCCGLCQFILWLQ